MNLPAGRTIYKSGMENQLPPITGVLETVLYAADLDAALGFYQGVIGLEHISGDAALSLGFRVAADAVLLIFDPAKSGTPGRDLPSHGSTGTGHIAFRIPDDAYDNWLARLESAAIPIEHQERWEPENPENPRSIYIRDPAGNSVELITQDIWR